MVNLIDLTNAHVDVLRRIPELVADLDQASPYSIVPYIDINPDNNDLQLAIYEMKAGSVMVAVIESNLLEEEMSAYEHTLHFYLKSQKGQSVLELVNDITNGVPVPGDGKRWYYCAVMPGMLPAGGIASAARAQDEEYIDYWVVTIKTKETGDA